MFEDGTEMEWVSNWVGIGGASNDGVIFNTDNSVYAGSWTDSPITTVRRYICEKN